MGTDQDQNERSSTQERPERVERERIPADWKTERRWHDDISGMSVELSRDHSVNWPKFAACIGRAASREERIRQFVPVIIDTVDGVSVPRYDFAWFTSVLAEMQHYCEDVRAEYTEEQTRIRAEREAARAARSARTFAPAKTDAKPIFRKGKTERDRERKRTRAHGE